MGLIQRRLCCRSAIFHIRGPAKEVAADWKHNQAACEQGRPVLPALHGGHDDGPQHSRRQPPRGYANEPDVLRG